MKKKIYLVLLALQLLTAFGYAAMADDVVRNIRLHKNTVHTRSLTEMPEASIFKDMLSVSFDDSGMYSLYIEDNFGVTVYTSALPANGMIVSAVSSVITAIIAYDDIDAAEKAYNDCMEKVNEGN